MNLGDEKGTEREPIERENGKRLIMRPLSNEIE